jgi:hypothetical protein
MVNCTGVMKMNAYEKIEKLNAQEFKLITGVTREVFEKMLTVLREEYNKDHSGGGAPGMSVELRLTLALEYWREYRTFRHMANDHQLPKSTINDAIQWVEYRLVTREEFQLADLKERFKPGEANDIKVIVVDVEEQPIERPTHEQKSSYSGKKKSIQANIKS